MTTYKNRGQRHAMLRVNLAGEYGAKCIYQGQLRILKNHATAPILNEMLQQEQEHLAFFQQQCIHERVRPSILSPLWFTAGHALGVITALMGAESAMACTMAVETAICEHYQQQIEVLSESDPLREKIIQFQADEQHHHDTAEQHNARHAPAFNLLSGIIQAGAKVAIAVAKKY